MMEVLQRRNGPMEFRDSSHILVFGVGYPQPCTLRLFLEISWDGRSNWWNPSTAWMSRHLDIFCANFSTLIPRSWFNTKLPSWNLRIWKCFDIPNSIVMIWFLFSQVIFWNQLPTLPTQSQLSCQPRYKLPNKAGRLCTQDTVHSRHPRLRCPVRVV